MYTNIQHVITIFIHIHYWKLLYYKWLKRPSRLRPSRLLRLLRHSRVIAFMHGYAHSSNLKIKTIHPGLLFTCISILIIFIIYITYNNACEGGGLGIRSVALLAPSAFLAPAAATQELQSDLLSLGGDYPDSGRDLALAVWMSRHDALFPEGGAQIHQKSWDKASIAKGQATLMAVCTDPYNGARLLASRAPHSGAWLRAWPITACGFRLDAEAIRVAVGPRLGVSLCTPHTCPCGALVDARDNHGFRVAEVQADRPTMPKSTTLSTGPWLELVSHPRGNRSVSCARATNVLTVVLW